MPADVLTLADGVVAELAAAFAAAPAAAEVSREYADRDDLATFAGLKVRVYPMSYTKPDAATRGEDYFDARLVLAALERFTGTGPVTNAWVDSRVNLVDEVVYATLANNDRVLVAGEFWGREVEVATVFNREWLREFQVFLSEIDVTYRRLREAP
jgi:hypothetical protein